MRRCAAGARRCALAYERTGQGPPVLAVHGLGGERRGWATLVPALARRYEVWAIDLPGFGESPCEAAAAFDIEGLSDAVCAFLDAVGLRAPLAVLGHSLGGWLALELARRGRAARVVAISPGGFWTERERRFATALLRASRALARALLPLAPRLLRHAPVRTLLLASMIGRPWRVPAADALRAVAAFARAPGFAPTLAALDRAGARLRDPQAITAPVTLLWGSRDRVLWPVQGRRAVQALANARLVALAGCGHAPFWDDPERVAAAVLEGLAGRR